jgi:hypothetical protein
VDGQQRLRAILDFADDRFPLSRRANEYAGKRYSDLTEEQQEQFLSYPIAVDQLVNASDDDVLEVFARLNSYTVPLNPPERRHAKFQGDFKWAIRAASRRWAHFWENYQVFTVRERVRMLDDSLTAEMVGVVLDGVQDGGQKKIDAIYKKYDEDLDPMAIQKLDRVLSFIEDKIAPCVKETPILSPPHLLMLFAGVASALVGIPAEDGKKTKRYGQRQIEANLDRACEELRFLGAVLDNRQKPGKTYEEFWKASSSTTHRIASRSIRFPFYARAVTPA